MSETSVPLHDANLRHHFTEMEQQVDAGKLGMWLFLVTEVLLFGGLFVGYGIMAGRHHEAFRAAHERGVPSLGPAVPGVLRRVSTASRTPRRSRPCRRAPTRG